MVSKELFRLKLVSKDLFGKDYFKKDFEKDLKHRTHLSRWKIILVMAADIISIHFRVSEWELLPKNCFEGI